MLLSQTFEHKISFLWEAKTTMFFKKNQCLDFTQIKHSNKKPLKKKKLKCNSIENMQVNLSVRFETS